MRLLLTGAAARLPLFMSTLCYHGGGKRTREWMCVHHGEEPHGVCTVAGKHCNPVTLRGLVERGAREREKLGWWRRGDGSRATLCTEWQSVCE